MGGGGWDTDVHVSSAATRKAIGVEDFSYHRAAMAAPMDKRTAHETLDPMGVDVRESRDSDEHPTSVAVAVMMDVTGSMHGLPKVIQSRLPDLLELLLSKGYVPDPQVLVGAFDDNRWKIRPPVQVAQFESDNRIDEHLRNVVMTGQGGGGGEESYELVAYFFARHTALDCWEKRQHKGYLFFIGDELPYSSVRATEVKEVFGYDIPQDIPVEQIFAELQERYHVVLLIPDQGNATTYTLRAGLWEKLIGPQNVVRVANVADIAEMIAVWVGLTERSVTAADAVTHMVERGRSKTQADAIAEKLAGATA